MTGTNGAVALEGGVRWIGLVFIITWTDGVGLRPLTGITSLNLLNNPLRLCSCYYLRKANAQRS